MNGDQDVRFQGVQFNYGAAYVHQTNNFASPSLDDELRSLRAHDHAYAPRWLMEKDDKQRKTVLNEYEKAHEVLNDVCAYKGYAAVADLLYGMNPERLMWLLERLEGRYQKRVFFELAFRLAHAGNAAQRHIRDYAKVDPERTAHLLINIARMKQVDSDRAFELLPDIDFVLRLPNQFAVRLLEALVFDLRGDYRDKLKHKNEAHIVLYSLIAADGQRTTRLIARLSPLRGARCITLLPLAAAVKLLAKMTEESPKAARDIVEELPWPIGRAVVGRVARDIGQKVAGPGITTWWPWIDGALAALTCIPFAMRRIAYGRGRRALGEELRNIRDTRKAATWAIRDTNYYRHQRNHIAWLAAIMGAIMSILALILLLT